MAIEEQRPIEITAKDVSKYDLKRYRKTGESLAVQMDAPFQVTTIQGNLAGGQPGDYLMVNPEDPRDLYPCAKHIFDSTYELVDDTPKKAKSSK